MAHAHHVLAEALETKGIFFEAHGSALRLAKLQRLFHQRVHAGGNRLSGWWRLKVDLLYNPLSIR